MKFETFHHKQHFLLLYPECEFDASLKVIPFESKQTLQIRVLESLAVCFVLTFEPASLLTRLLISRQYLDNQCGFKTYPIPVPEK